MKTSTIAAIVVIIIIIAAVGAYAAISLGGTSTSTSTSSSSSSISYGPNVTIAMSVSQSGSYQPLDSGYLYFNIAWQDYVNSHGGLVDANGQHHLVTVMTGDDKSDVPAGTASTLYHSYADNHEANILVSPYSANIGLELLPIAQSDHVPLIMAEASTVSMWNGTYTWAVTPLAPYWQTNSQFGWSGSYFSLLNQTQWAHTIGFVGWQISWAQDDYASSLYLANHTTGLKVVSQALITPNFVNPDFTPQINALKTAVNGTSPPDIIYCAMFGPFCATFITQAAAQGLHPKEWHTIEWGASFASALSAKGVSTSNITSDVFWTPTYPTSNAGTTLFNQLLTSAQALQPSGTASVTWYNYQNVEIRMYIFQMITASVGMIPSANFSSATTLDASLNNALHHLSNLATISGPLTIEPLGYGTIGLATVQWQNNEIQTVFPSNVANTTYAHPNVSMSSATT